MTEKIPEVVYHYCSLPSFYSIISHKNIRLSCHSMTNDYFECIWIDNILDEVLSRCVNDDGFVKQVAHQFHYTRNFAWRTQYNFIACFSEHGDKLSQWRAYADDGRGVSIGFSTCAAGFADLFCNERTPIFGKVIYNKDQQIQALKDVINKHESGYNPACELNIDHLLCSHDLLRVAPFIKNDAFEEEGEYRLVCNPDIGFDILGNIEVNNATSDMKFHVNESGLRPYFEFSFPEFNLSKVVSHVILGPKANQESFFIECFLNSHGFHPSIERSRASYR